MKYLIAMVLGLALVACAVGGGNPESVAKNFVEKMYAGDADAVIKMIHIAEVDKKPGAEEWVSGKIKMGVAKEQERAQKEGGVVEITTEAAQISPNDNKQATVKVQTRFKSGKTRSDNVKLIDAGNGWQIRL